MECYWKNPFKKVTHVIFDLDGTLIDSDLIYDQIYREVIKKFGKNLQEELLSQVHGLTKTTGLALVKEKLQIEADVEEMLDEFMTLTRERIPDVKLMKGAEEIVRHLYDQNIPIAIASSTTSEKFGLKTSKHEELFQLFHHVVLGDDPSVYKVKPNPCIYLVAAERFIPNPDPSECLVFEDMLCGVHGGLRAGMQVIMVPNKTVPHSEWKQATMRLDALSDAPLELFGLPGLTPPPLPCYLIIEEQMEGEEQGDYNYPPWEAEDTFDATDTTDEADEVEEEEEAEEEAVN